MLDPSGKYNQLSEQLRKEIMDAYEACGKKVVYHFDISHNNPNTDRGAAKKIFPMLYELSPITFQIIDKYSKKVVNIGIPADTDEKGNPIGFKRIWVKEFMRGTYDLALGTAESRDIFAYMYLHPKHTGGKYQNKDEQAKFKQADKVGDAKSSYSIREQRADAVAIARNMTTQEVMDFASAMAWDEHEEPIVLKEQIMEMAETETVAFMKFTEGNITYKATIKRALDNQVLEFVPVENKYVWAGNKQTLAALERGDGTMQGSIEQLADWLVTSKNGKEIYNRIVTLLKKENAAA